MLDSQRYLDKPSVCWGSSQGSFSQSCIATKRTRCPVLAKDHSCFSYPVGPRPSGCRCSSSFYPWFVGYGGRIAPRARPDLVYDTVLDITWTREAGDGVQRSWADSVACADNLVFAGLGDWRLPSARVSQGAGPTMLLYICTGGGADELACRDDEMGYMYYYNLNGTAGDDKSNDQLAVGGQCS
jgi:hypothetical protein